MSNGIIFATGGTTRKARLAQHQWQDFDFVCMQAAQKLAPVFDKFNVSKIANCMAAGGLWGGFIFVQEISKYTNRICYPFGSSYEISELAEFVVSDKIDTLVALPNFAVRFFDFCKNNKINTDKVKVLFYFGEAFSEEDKKLIPPHISIRPMAYTTQETGVLGFNCIYSDDAVYHLFQHVDGVVSDTTGGFVVDVKFPSGTVIKKHETNDCVDMFTLPECPCGHPGRTIKFKDREESFSNVLGTSISSGEIKRAYSALKQSWYNKINNIQIVSGVKEGKSYVDIMISCHPELHTVTIDQLVEVNALINELYKDAEHCNLMYVRQDLFVAHPISGKIKFHIIKNIEKSIC